MKAKTLLEALVRAAARREVATMIEMAHEVNGEPSVKAQLEWDKRHRQVGVFAQALRVKLAEGCKDE